MTPAPSLRAAVAEADVCITCTTSNRPSSLNGKPLFAVEDATFPEAGMVGVWTKADSVTAFSGFTYSERR